MALGISAILAAAACGGSIAIEEPLPTATVASFSASQPPDRTETKQADQSPKTPTPTPTSASESFSPTRSPVPSPLRIPSTTASAITFPPADLTGINAWHTELEKEDSVIRFVIHADPEMITLGPLSGGPPGYDSYPGKTSMNIKMPEKTPVLAPADMNLIGFANRSAEFRGDGADRQSPFDDLEICFESADSDWPGMIVCIYHLSTSPLLPGHNQSPGCTAVERWDINSPGQAEGWLYFEDNDAYYEADGSSSDTARDARLVSPLPCRSG